MSQVDVTDCQTADDVRKLAKRVLIHRKHMRDLPELPIAIAQPILIEPSPPLFVPEPEPKLEPEPECQVHTAAARMMIRDVQLAALWYFNYDHWPKLTLVDLLSARRTTTVVWPRQMAMYICKQLTLHTYPELGRRFGGRDHTTVLHAVNKIDRLRAVPQSSAEQDYLGVLGVLRERGFTVPDLEEAAA